MTYTLTHTENFYSQFLSVGVFLTVRCFLTLSLSPSFTSFSLKQKLSHWQQRNRNHPATYTLRTHAVLTPPKHTFPSVHSWSLLLLLIFLSFFVLFIVFCFFLFRWIDNGCAEWMWKSLSSINTCSGICAFEHTLNSYICWHSEYFNFTQFLKSPSLCLLWWMMLHIVIRGLFYVFLMATSVDTATVFISSDSKDFSRL